MTKEQKELMDFIQEKFLELNSQVADRAIEKNLNLGEVAEVMAIATRAFYDAVITATKLSAKRLLEEINSDDEVADKKPQRSKYNKTDL